uniref:Ovule protein n=1 Tax=Parastrongyloides trichosuri TaxID=131310 RepID=A0A0N4ZDA2_PARTI
MEGNWCSINCPSQSQGNSTFYHSTLSLVLLGLLSFILGALGARYFTLRSVKKTQSKRKEKLIYLEEGQFSQEPTIDFPPSSEQ